MRRLRLSALPLSTAIFLIVVISAHAQRINISNFYYRDYLDFGQNKGVFKESAESSTGAFTLTGKDSSTLMIPRIPTFQASSNYGSLTSVGRGFAITASHVTSPENDPYKTPQEVNTSGPLQRQWGLTSYIFAKEDDGDSVKSSISRQYGYDEKFLRFTKYIVEGQVGMLDFDNNAKKKDSTKTTQDKNIENFRTKLNGLETNSDGNVYIYQAGSGMVTLRGTSKEQKFNAGDNGEMKGGGFGYFRNDNIQYGCLDDKTCGNIGMWFYYYPNIEKDFNNRITSGDSGSGIYAYDKTNNKWVLVGVVSKEWEGQNRAFISAVSQTDFRDYQKNFEQSIKINKNNLSLEKMGASPVQLKGNDREATFNNNKDIIFSGNGDLSKSDGITIEVKTNIDRNISGNAGGFVFIAGDKATKEKPTTYKFTNEKGKTFSFGGSGLDIGENVSVEWHLKNQNANDSLHKIGKGELIIKTQNSATTGLGNLKIGEGKVTLDTDKKAYDNIYITSGRGELTLKTGKAEALGATKSQNQARSGTQSAESYTLAQNKNSEMGFYFGTGGGKLDLGGNSLTLNTIAANDSGATITNSSGSATLTIEGLGYESSGNKGSTKKDTIIHASVGDTNSNIDLQYSGNKSNGKAKSAIQNSEAHLIFDGNINTKGKMEVTNGNVALQGHATAHATIGDNSLIEQIKQAEKGTSKEMPDYMDLSKPSTLKQPDWDNRSFKFGSIDLKGANLTLGRNATLESDITASNNSKITFGAGGTHFIDNNDGKNITGSGFSYYQKVEQGNLTGEALKGANESISYKGKITANGGEIKSSIFDFNASLDLKSGAKLTADYLTIQKSSSIKLATGTSASVKTLKLDKISNSDLSSIFKNGSSEKLKVTDMIWLENTQNLTLNALDSANIDKNNYDIWATKSSVNDGTKEVTANVELFEGSNFVLKSLTLKNITDSAKNNKSAESSQDSTKIDSTKIKNRVYLGNTANGSDFTKLTLSDKLSAQNLDSAVVELRGKSELKAQSIEFSGVKNGKLILDSESKLTGANGNANVVVKGADSTLNIYFDGEKKFDINASGANTNITLGLLQIAESSVDSAIQNAKFSGKITAQDSSVITTALDSITANVDLSGTAKLTAQNITLDSTHNSISLKGTSMLTADKISANNVSTFKLTQENGANLSVKNISLTNSTLQASALTFGGAESSAESSIITSDDKSKLEVANLNITSGNLTLNLADSAKNVEKLSAIDISNGGSVSFTNKWDFGASTNFKSNGGTGRVTFNDATYTHSGSAKTISADSAINGELSLLGVGKTPTQKAKNADSAKSFETLKFENKKLEFGGEAKIKVTFDEGVKKGASDITLGQYYTLVSASEISDNRSDKRIDFNFASGVSEGEKLFVVSKFDKDKLQVKFLNDNPKTFGELIKNIDKNYADILGVLMEHNGDDESIDIATRTDDYGILNARLRGIDSAMNNLAQSHHTHTTRTLLSANNNAIDTRITQVRLLASANARKKPLYFAYNDTMQSIMKAQNGGIASDAAPSYKIAESSEFSENERPNDIWLNVGGGYFGGAQSIGFAAINIGYDRLMDFEGGDVLVGGMLGFGVSKGAQGGSDFSESAQFYNFGIYAHSVFGASGGAFGGNEIQGNVNFSIHNNAKTINSKSAQNTATGFLVNIYYKYRFVLKSDETSLYALKPVALLGFGYNHSGAFSAGEYKVDARGEGALMLGLGVEYNFVQSESYYSVAFIAQDRAFRTKNSASVSLNNAKSFIGYTITSAPSVDFTLNFTGAHNIASGFYVQYGIMGLVDTSASYGVKGDLKVGYRF